jgi:hypothetical protein
MTIDQMQSIFESTLSITVSIFIIGYGIGMIIRLIKSAVDK